MEWQDLLKEFYGPFSEALQIAKKEMEKVPLESGEDCPNCGNPLLIKGSRYGDFIGCSGYTTCTFKKPKLDKIGLSCRKEDCMGEVITRRSKKGHTFYGCSNYPTCTFTSWYKPVDKACPDCSSFMVLKRMLKGNRPYLACSSTTCKKYIFLPKNS